MALQGDLASVDLAQVFQMLSLNQKVGILGIDATRASRALHFDSRGVTMFFDPLGMAERIIMSAQRRGMMNEGGLQDARAHSQRTGQTLLEALCAGGYMTDEDVGQMMRAELEEDIYDVFFWRQAQFEFYENATTVPSNEQIDERFYFSVDVVIMEAARRIDEWAFIQKRVKSGDDVFQARNVDGSALGSVDSLVFGLADGMRNVARLIELTGLPRFQVFKTLAVLHEGGYVEVVPDEDLWGFARECVKRDRAHDAIDLYERAIESGADCTKIRAEVAGVYEAVDEYALAAAHLTRVAVAHVEAGEIQEAVRHYSHLVKMLPTDLSAREQLVALAVSLPESQRDGLDPTADGKQLVDLYMEIGEVERVRAILEQLLRDSPNDLALKKRLINVHNKAGDTRRVVELYESIADDLVRARQPIEAVKYLQKIVMIDRSRKDISERIRGLYEADERRRSRRRSLLALGALLMLLSALAGVWYVYERYAREQMVALTASINQMTQAEEFDQAIAQLDEFITKYPLTIVSNDASAEKARVESLRASYRNKQQVAERQKDFERQELRKRYRTEWIEYESHARAKDLGKALAAIKIVQELVTEAGQPQDLEWAREKAVQNNRFDLERYISESARLDREATAKLAEGDWQGARDQWIELITDYDISAKARTVRVPVLIHSRPLGARVTINGQPMTRSATDSTRLVTPAVVLCRPNKVERVVLELEGFAPAELSVDGIAAARVDSTLQVLPKSIFTFDNPVRAPVAIGSKFLAAGLRSGQLAVANIETGEVRMTRQLEGLDEVRGRPSIAVDRCYYLTSEGYLASRRTSNGELIWRERLPAEPVHEPILHAGRVLIADHVGNLHGYDPLTGRKLWTVQLGGNVSGAPCVSNGVVYCGLRERKIVGVDLVTRRISVTADQLENGVATPLFAVAGGYLYGDDAGAVVFRQRVKGPITWSFDTGRPFTTDQLVVSGDDVFVRYGKTGLVRLRAVDGKKLASLDLGKPIVSGPVVSDHRVFVVVRVDQPRRRSTDMLKALNRDSLELEWEFEDGGRFVAAPTTDRQSLYLPDSKGDVLRFR